MYVTVILKLIDIIWYFEKMYIVYNRASVAKPINYFSKTEANMFNSNFTFSLLHHLTRSQSILGESLAC